jgi:hypothetical protein
MDFGGSGEHPVQIKQHGLKFIRAESGGGLFPWASSFLRK